MKTIRQFCHGLLATRASSPSMPSATVAELEAAEYAVIVQRDAETWVRAASDIRAVASIELESMVSTDGYDEWVVEVWHVGEQRRVRYRPRVVVWIGDVAAETQLPTR